MNLTTISIKTGATFSLAQYSTTPRMQIKHFLHSFTPTSWIAQYMLKWCSAQSWGLHNGYSICVCPQCVLENGDVSKCYTGLSGGSRISPRRGRQLSRGRQHTILPHFPKNCMKLKEFGPQGAVFGKIWQNRSWRPLGSWRAPLAPPLDPRLGLLNHYQVPILMDSTVRSISSVFVKEVRNWVKNQL